MDAGNNETRACLETSAVHLFARRWYSSVSVAEICREAGLSNGIFYSYFHNKEELLRSILDDIISQIARALDPIEGDTRHERLKCMVEKLVLFSAANPELITVFREGQYRYFEYEQRLAELYAKVLSKVLGRTAGMAEYLFAIGGIRFAAIRAALHGAKVSTDALVDIIENGVFAGLAWDPEKVFSISVTPPVLSLDEGSRERLLLAGKRLFGEQDFHKVNIHQITDAAGLSVGAFYKHFDGKESFFGELIESAGREVRHFITSHLKPDLNRLEREMQGIFLFGIFLSLDRWCYNIVREGEFVAPEKAREYYAAFEKGYRKLADSGLSPNKISQDPLYEDTAIEFLLGISHYYGIEVVFDDSPRNARAVVESIGTYLSRGFSR